MKPRSKFLIFKRIVGGSSGGEGCIVSSAGSVMGIGSDIGGSIRMVIYLKILNEIFLFNSNLLKPAFFNGVYGHKVSE